MADALDFLITPFACGSERAIRRLAVTDKVARVAEDCGFTVGNQRVLDRRLVRVGWTDLLGERFFSMAVTMSSNVKPRNNESRSAV